MSNSSLASYIDRTSGSYESRSNLISKITIHIAHATGDCHDLAEFILSGESSSFHYGIATDGTIGLFIDEKYKAWGTGNSANDDIAVQIVLMNDKEGSTNISDKTYDALVNLVEDICRRNYILEMTYDGTYNGSTLTKHSWFKSGVNCPGPYVGGRYANITSVVNSRLQSARTASSQAEARKSQSTIATNYINPYLVVPDDDYITVNYTDLKIMGCVGTMFRAGTLFDSKHNRNSKYINPYLKSAVANADYYSMPYALYADVRAKSLEEAKAECYWLYFVISKYPPILGLWLHLELTDTNRNVAKQIVDYYYSKIVKWGLKAKCGFYCNTTNARWIEYKNYVDKFAIWWIAPLSSTNDLDDLLTPALFKI